MSDQKIIELAKKRFKIASEMESELRQEALEDLKFRAGDQWPQDIKSERDNDSKPCLVINRIPQFVRQVTNDQRQNRPSIKVHPVDDRADIDTAKVYQGLIRHIEANSNADIAYDKAFESAAIQGFGYFRIITDYVSPYSLEQEILIRRIPNAFSVFLDPFAKEPDGSDAKWGIIFENISKEDYVNMYGESKLANMDDWAGLGGNNDWIQSDQTRIAEYYYIEHKDDEVLQFQDGSTALLSELQESGIEISVEDIIGRRKTKIPQVKWCKTNGFEILEKTDVAGRWIPIIPVIGDELLIDGKKVLEGVVRHARDPQRMYNYWASCETETIALAPKAPYIMAEGQITKDNQRNWEQANRKSFAYLTYKQTDFNGRPAPPPQRQIAEPPVQAITNARLMSSDDLKASTGIYDAALGNRSNENSGVAIQRRNIQSQTSNFHLIDNLTRAIKHGGRIIVAMIPSVYDTPRVARIIGEEGEEEIIKINQAFNQNGKPTEYDLGVGKYDVSVDVGPSFASKRQEAAASMEAIIKAYPGLFEIAGDLMVKNMDLPGASEMAERIKKTLRPGLAEDDKNKDIPPEIQAQVNQMAGVIEQQSAQLQEAQEIINQKRLELEYKQETDFEKMKVDLEKEKLKVIGPQAIEAINQQIDQLNQRLNDLSMTKPQMDEPEMVDPQMVEPQMVDDPNFVNEADPYGVEPLDQNLNQKLPGELPPEIHE